MTVPSVDRRGEAHLWLLLEEALVAVRGTAVEPWEAWRNFRAVADALVDVGALDTDVGEALVGELDDALALRGVIPAGAFTAAPWPPLEVLTAPRATAPPADAATVWLEAEIERHLDLFASFGPDARAWAAADMLRILGGPVRAFGAVGLLPAAEGTRVLDDLTATLAAAEVDPGRPVEPDAGVRGPWLAFLQGRPAPLPEPFTPTERRLTRDVLGELPSGEVVRLDGLAWGDGALEVGVAIRRGAGGLAARDRTPWSVRVLDDLGHLHLGQPAVLRVGAAGCRVALRPGLDPGVTRLEVRVTHGPHRVEGAVAL